MIMPTKLQNMPDVLLTPEQIEQIAEIAATKAIERVYVEIGKNVVKKFFWFIGVCVVIILASKNGSQFLDFFKP